MNLYDHQIILYYGTIAIIERAFFCERIGEKWTRILWKRFRVIYNANLFVHHRTRMVIWNTKHKNNYSDALAFRRKKLAITIQDEFPPINARAKIRRSTLKIESVLVVQKGVKRIGHLITPSRPLPPPKKKKKETDI